MREHDTGCLLCGEPLLYLEAAEPMRCALCGASRASSARCAAGHFACDACHSGGANEAVERICAGSESRDPVEIALLAMRHPKVKMHGPEHHFLVPAALVAAWCNATGGDGREGGPRRRGPAPGTLPAGTGSHTLEPMPDHPAQADPRIQDATAARYAALAGSTARLSCGAALELAEPRPGESLVDLGCGRGRDLLRAAGMVGPAGRVTGVDASPAMLAAATATIEASRAGPAGGVASVRLVRADLADIDLPDGIADVAISNCAINHAPDKRAVFAEIHRLLRPGGRAVVSDVIAERELPASVRDDPAAWAACYGGAIPEAEYLAAIRAAGLVEVEILARTEPYEKGGVEVRSLTVRARRPSQARPSLPASSGPGPLPEVTP